MRRKIYVKGIALTMFYLIFIYIICTNAKQVRAGDYSSAQILSLNGAWGSEYWLTDTEREQWYKIVVPSDGELTYKVMGYGRFRFKLYDEDCSLCLSSDSTGGSESSPSTTTVTEVLSKGIYYLKITPNGSLGKYKLNASFLSYHTNDDEAISYDFPQKITLGNFITGAITNTDGEDWYCIDIPSNGYYQHHISAFCRIAYSLYNADLSEKVKSGYLGGGKSSPAVHKNDIVFSPGRYYLKVHSIAGGSCGKYIFGIFSLNPSICDHNYESTFINPTYTTQGYTLHICSKCGHSYKDEYLLKRKLKTPYIYYLYAKKKKATVSWAPVSDASGYEISYKVKNKAKN